MYFISSPAEDVEGIWGFISKICSSALMSDEKVHQIAPPPAFTGLLL